MLKRIHFNGDQGSDTSIDFPPVLPFHLRPDNSLDDFLCRVSVTEKFRLFLYSFFKSVDSNKCLASLIRRCGSDVLIPIVRW